MPVANHVAQYTQTAHPWPSELHHPQIGTTDVQTHDISTQYISCPSDLHHQNVTTDVQTHHITTQCAQRPLKLQHPQNGTTDVQTHHIATQYPQIVSAWQQGQMPTPTGHFWRQQQRTNSLGASTDMRPHATTQFTQTSSETSAQQHQQSHQEHFAADDAASIAEHFTHQQSSHLNFH